MSDQPDDRTISTDAERTVTGVSVTCPVCEAVNPPAEQWCVDCGFLLTETPGEGPPALAEAAFVILHESKTGMEYPLQEGANPVGRLSGVVPLARDEYASREHAAIEVSPPEIWLRDLNSTNGTFVNGVKLAPDEPRRLYDGDQVRFAQTAFEVVAASSGKRPEEEKVQVVATLKVLEGPHQALTFPLPQGEHVLGREPGADISLVADPYVSGRHARLHLQPDSATLEDLQSRNGTLLNDERLEPNCARPVATGDRMKVGTSVLELVIEQSETQGEQET